MSEKLSFHYIVSPTLEMRKLPDSKSEIVSQGLFSENVHILNEHENWAQIETGIDHYSGWVKKEGFFSRSTPFLLDQDLIKVKTCRLATHLYHYPDTIYGPILTLPFESLLGAIPDKNENCRWLKVILPNFHEAYVQRGDLTFDFLKMNRKEVCRFSLFFLGLPYTWGGRSSFGYDCSGFVQMLYRQMGIFLSRDSKDQFMNPNFTDCPISSLDEADLIFFGFSKERILHVGFCLDKGRFIHNSAVTENRPYIRISHFADSAWNGNGYYPFVAGRKLTL